MEKPKEGMQPTDEEAYVERVLCQTERLLGCGEDDARRLHSLLLKHFAEGDLDYEMHEPSLYWVVRAVAMLVPFERREDFRYRLSQCYLEIQQRASEDLKPEFIAAVRDLLAEYPSVSY